MRVKIVFFDALFTIVQPRIPIFEQYHRVLTPKLGPLNPVLLKDSFKTALGEVQQERPAYGNGKTGPVESDAVRSWWKEVIRRTALGAGADPEKTDKNLEDAVTELLHIFSSKEGYKLTDGTLQTISTLKTELGIRSGLVSNCDARILCALEDLEIAAHLNPVVVSELEQFEKPDARMWQVACQRSGIELGEAVHVGDDFDADVLGATRAGVRAIWYRPLGQDNNIKGNADNMVPDGVAVVEKLVDVIDIVRRWNQSHA
ncbi:HAD hydrolase subfamily IA REG-2-like protein [Rhizoctonia solani]|nr:HAD hydrolase subfamily IA REG-2-like protein [Rhizoctonia solani]